jgi:DnaJ-domain-containing protein 1
MSMWTAIVLIVIAAMASEAWRHHVKARSAAPRLEELDELKRKIDELNADLRSRVETLERIVTDDKETLKRQFDKLG